MKTMFTRAATTLAVVVAGLVCASPSFGDDSAAANAGRDRGKVYKGTVSAIDAVENTVTVQGTIFSKKFNTADACKVSLEDKPEAMLSDLRVGQRVEVHYQSVRGVLAAGQIIQHNLTLKGYVNAIDPGNRMLAVKTAMSTQEFKVAENCSVILKDKRAGTLLMVAHMNETALRLTVESGDAWSWSRSRGALWRKGETSGHTQKVVELRIDCDQDAVWLQVEQTGPACHTGAPSCFYRAVRGPDGRLERA